MMVASAKMVDAHKDHGESKTDKVTEVADRFKKFEHGMQVKDNKSKADKEDDEIQSIKANITRLENILNQEVKRRTDTNRAIQSAFEAHISTVGDKLEAGLFKRLDSLMTDVEALNERVGVVEEEFSTARQGYIRDMEDKSTLVADDIVALKSVFTTERTERKERETLIIAKLKDLDRRTAEQMVKDDEQLDKHVIELNMELGVVGHEEDRKFHEFVFTELAALRTGLENETQLREQADDEIVAALNHYTQSVQEAMRVVNQGDK
jgi:hypothetical protein